MGQQISIIKKREIARDIIKSFDEATSRKWTGDDNAIIEAFLRFNEMIDNTEHDDVIPADDSKLILKVDEIVNIFYKNSNGYFKAPSQYYKGEQELIDYEIGELRAKLSTYLYTLARRYFKAISLSKGSSKALAEKAEAQAYKRIFDEQVKQGNSVSFSDNYARKMYKADPEYLKVLKETEEVEQEYWEAIQVFERARDILNSMAKNKNI